jgi:hypothetical protein
MSRLDMIRSAAVVMAALVTLAGPAARAQEFVVVQSTVPALPAGTVLANGATLGVPAQGRVVLVAASGQVVTVSGPFQGVPPAAAGGSQAGTPQMLKVLQTLIGKNDQRQTPGAVRGTDVAWRSETARTLGDVLAINATDGGDVCLYDPSHAEVTHNPANVGTMTIHAMSADAAASLDWAAGTQRLPWPAALPLEDGGTYLFEQAGQDAAAVATVHVLQASAAANPATSDVLRVTQLAQAGCNDQAKLLLALIVRAAQ